MGATVGYHCRSDSVRSRRCPWGQRHGPGPSSPASDENRSQDRDRGASGNEGWKFPSSPLSRLLHHFLLHYQSCRSNRHRAGLGNRRSLNLDVVRRRTRSRTGTASATSAQQDQENTEPCQQQPTAPFIPQSEACKHNPGQRQKRKSEVRT